jgi:DNA mismatch repair protein MutH
MSANQKLPYNLQNKNSVLEYAKRLTGNSLKTSCDASIIEHGYTGKGNFGQVLEKFYFMYEPNSDALPDFAEISMELKSSPLKKLNNDEYRAKERLVLNIINYVEVATQKFETSSFWKKNSHLLLVFYFREEGIDILDYIIKLVGEWSFPPHDLQIIKNDWQIITNKIASGHAHELSEGDTFYLAACTKGGKGGNPRKQHGVDILAKQRAYSLKQGYVNHIIASIANEPTEVYGKIIPNNLPIKQTIEQIVISKISEFYNLTVEEILNELNEKLNPSTKNYFSSVTKLILGIEANKEIEEFHKAEIEIKTVRLREDFLPKENTSFPAFQYAEIINQDWEDSEFRETLEHKFLFVFFQFENDRIVLRKAKFWNMPVSDIENVKIVWDTTKEVIKSGNIVREIKKGIRYTNFPKKSENEIAHVRPHATTTAETYPLPVLDRVTASQVYTKHSFWLNDTYIRDEIYLKE